MLFNSLTAAATLSLLAHVNAQQVHGQGAAGTTMGAVAFMWPADRPWSAATDNIGPCGSAEGPSNRTSFPLGSAGAVSFSIADESTNIELRIAYGNNPTRQEEFTQFHSTISTFEPGHQCRSVPASPSSIVAGTNATLQLEYWGNDSGKDESFFACADITFVDAVAFDTSIPCFNVTSEEFTPAGATPTTTITSPSSTAASESAASSNVVVTQTPESNGGLSTAEKAGIAVATIVGAFLVASVVFFMIRRKRAPVKDAETAPGMTKVASYHSGDVAPRN